MEFYIRTGAEGGAPAAELIRRIACGLPIQPTLVTPCMMDDWRFGIAKTVALQRWEPQWGQQIRKGDQCLLLDVGGAEDPEITLLRRRGAAVLGWLEPPLLRDRRYRKRLRRCDAVLTQDVPGYQQARRMGLRRVFLLAGENKPRDP